MKNLEQCSVCNQLTDWNKPIGRGYTSLLCLDCSLIWNKIQEVMLEEEIKNADNWNKKQKTMLAEELKNINKEYRPTNGK